MKKLLLHTCCGPCSIYPLQSLQNKDYDVYGLFYNPNIHPYTEFKKRRDQLEDYAQKQAWKVIFDENYGLEEYLQEVVHREIRRCQLCYNMRLKRTAQMAKKGNFDAFSTTLLVSPFQKHELIKELGETLGQQYDVEFYYEDFRPGFKEATAKSKELEMYRQQYCGCIYSEKDRYYRPVRPKSDGR
ncbi:epoxyqueuosine reductase QueH [Desulforamulus aquiferis]|uniref:Epoxyqueuosine reductase QueH n=1 Tax=Desulforamulus aquiferis TaxID=1397668 RepID=A0AAW7ZIG7_9FIRM|nr:epoxyqueuosine reductase QueH [Desulforamulus aquiferis]MDO7788864.1 epoxyqueuosine reductase QueH [Desulforamulus aquiferis]RYD06408.1 hypothetical protein N752_04395 [Desulforamulus aquiferis]